MIRTVLYAHPTPSRIYTHRMRKLSHALHPPLRALPHTPPSPRALCSTMMFGTDHPFFPPAEGGTAAARWPSTDKNHEAIAQLEPGAARRVRSANARKLLRLD